MPRRLPHASQPARFVAAMEALRDGRLREAERAFSSVTARYPHFVAAYEWLGRLLTQQERYLDADRVCAAGLTRCASRYAGGRELLGLRRTRAVVRAHLGFQQEAIRELRLLHRTHTDMEAARALAGLLFAEGDRAEAETLYLTAARESHRIVAAEIYRELSEWQERYDDLNKAITYAQLALTLNPQLRDMYLRCAQLLLAAGRCEEAGDLLVAGARCFPKDPALAVTTAHVLCDCCHRWTEGGRWLKRALRLRPDDPTLLCCLAATLVHHYGYASALDQHIAAVRAANGTRFVAIFTPGELKAARLVALKFERDLGNASLCSSHATFLLALDRYLPLSITTFRPAAVAQELLSSVSGACAQPLRSVRPSLPKRKAA